MFWFSARIPERFFLSVLWFKVLMASQLMRHKWKTKMTPPYLDAPPPLITPPSLKLYIKPFFNHSCSERIGHNLEQGQWERIPSVFKDYIKLSWPLISFVIVLIMAERRSQAARVLSQTAERPQRKNAIIYYIFRASVNVQNSHANN